MFSSISVPRVRAFACIALASLLPSLSGAQLRVANWNVTAYNGGRIEEFKTAIYATFNGRSLRPDILIGQEFISQSAVNSFLGILNTAPGSPGDWAAAPFIDGADTDGAFFYRMSKVDYLGMKIVAVGSPSPTNQPRNTYRYDVRLKNYTGPGATLACYCSHMKAGNTTTDQARRLVEAERIRDDVDTLNSQWQYLLGADLNIQTSSQQAYQVLLGPSPTFDTGPFRDPIKTPGGWNNNWSFRYVHTQDPSTEMDDRYDFVLLGPGLVDGAGFDYIGNPNIPYSTSIWNDPNHSYRSWGNDGTTYNTVLATLTNQMVGPTIAQALIDAAMGNGHLPVYLDLRVPPKALTTSFVDFGIVAVGQVVQRPVQVWNSGDVALWNQMGIADLTYTLAASPGFIVPTGPFSDAPGGGANTHFVRIDTSTPGVKSGFVTVTTNDPDQPVRLIAVKGLVKSAIAPPGG